MSNQLKNAVNTENEENFQVLIEDGADLFSLYHKEFEHPLWVSGENPVSIFDYPFVIGEDHDVRVELLYNDDGTVGLKHQFRTDENTELSEYLLNYFIDMLYDCNELDDDGKYVGGFLTTFFEQNQLQSA